MMRTFDNLPALLATTRSALAHWLCLAGAATLTLTVIGLEIWLRVPVRPAINQMLQSGCPHRRGDSLLAPT